MQKVLSLFFSVSRTNVSYVLLFTEPFLPIGTLLVCLGLAMLCKETGVTIVAVCSVMDLYFVCQVCTAFAISYNVVCFASISEIIGCF